MKRLALPTLVLGSLLLASPAQAQTVNRTLTWTQPGETPSLVSTYTWGLKVDAATVAPITPTCQTAGANVTCSTPIVLTPGSHQITVSVVNTAGISNSGTFNYVSPAGPAAPINFQITFQITVP